MLDSDSGGAFDLSIKFSPYLRGVVCDKSGKDLLPNGRYDYKLFSLMVHRTK